MIGITKIIAMANTGSVMNSPYQPGPGSPPGGCGRSETMATARIATYVVPVIHQSRYSPVARAYSLNPPIDNSHTNTIVPTRPMNTQPSTIAAITSQLR